MANDSSVASGYAKSECKVTTFYLNHNAFGAIFSFCKRKTASLLAESFQKCELFRGHLLHLYLALKAFYIRKNPNKFVFFAHLYYLCLLKTFNPWTTTRPKTQTR